MKTFEADPDEVVISGVGGHFPECDNLEEFKDSLMNEIDVLTDNAERWKPGRLGLTSRTGKVSGIDKFDAVFFGMHRKLTDATDPLSRIIMERVFEAIVDAGINPYNLRGTRTGVFIGTALSESENIFIQTTAEDGFGIMGHNRSMMANRVSYYFDFKGPSYALDSSFCSGLTALEQGKHAIDSGEVDQAIVGCATLSFHPEITQHFLDVGYASADATTKPFDQNADGWGRSEAAICLLLQKRGVARRVYASVVHVKVKKYGEEHSTPLLQLNPDAHVRLLNEFYSEAERLTGITPDDVDYLEAEGGGYKPWDELEVRAVDKVVCARRSKPLLIGSTKGSTGHGEATSGLVALCKVLVAMETGVIPATLNHERTNPALRALVEGRLQLVTSKQPLPVEHGERGALVALNNFGLSNMYGHALLRANPKGKDMSKVRFLAKAEDAAAVGEKVAVKDEDDIAKLRQKTFPMLVFVSARNEAAIKVALDKLHTQPGDPEYARLLHDVYASHTFGHLQRAYTFLPKTSELPYEAAPHGGAKRPVWFVFSGMGSQWAGMARDLLCVPVFRAALQRCHDALLPHGVDLMHIVTTRDGSIYENILHSFVGIAAVQIGLTDVLTALGIKADGIIGHSVGELGCGYADGCFTAEQMVLAAHARGRASIETELIRGTMAAVGLGYEEVRHMLPDTIEVACHNSANSSTISGPAEDMHRFVGKLSSQDIFVRPVNVSNIAYHSRYIAPAGPKLLELLRQVLPEPKRRSPRWVSTSVLEARWGEPLAATSSAEYHTNNLLSPVFFEEGSRKIPKDAICIEIAPHGLLQAILRRSLDAGVTNIPLTRRDAPNGAVFLLEAIGKMYLAGLNPQVQNLYDPVEYPVSRGTAPITPLVSWDHSETWYTGRYSQQTESVPAERHLPVRSLDPTYTPYRDLQFNGCAIITPAICLEKVCAMIRRINDDEPVQVVFEDVQFYRIVEMPIVEEALVYVLYQRGSGRFEVSVDMRILARGRAYVPIEGLKKMWSTLHPSSEHGRIVTSQDEVYDELERRGLRVAGKLRGLKQVVVSPSDVHGRVAYHGSHELLLDTLLQLYTLQDSETRAELCVPHRVQRILLDPDRSFVSREVGDEDNGTLVDVDELVFRMHRASATLRCAGIEIRGVSTRPFVAPVEEVPLAIDQEQFLVHGDHPASLKRAEEFVSVALQLAGLQVALQPLCHQSTETMVGVLDNVDSAFDDLLRHIGRREAHALVRAVTPQEAAECDLLVVQDAVGVERGCRLLASHGLLLARLPLGVPLVPHLSSAVQVLLQQVFGAQRLVLLKKVQAQQPATQPGPQTAHVMEVESAEQLAGLEVAANVLTYLVWRSMPDQGIPALLRDAVRVVPGAHRLRSVFLLDSTAPKFSPTHPFYAAQTRLGLAASVFLNGNWGNLYRLPRQLVDCASPRTTLPVNKLRSIPDLDLEFLGLNAAGMEPTNIEVRDGHILDIKWPPAEKQARGAGLLDYTGTRRVDQVKVMGVLDTETLDADPILAWDVPDNWSMEDAATVPYAYTMAYLALIHTAKLMPGEPVLVHDGWSPVGQAALDVALAVGCPVYTTYRTEEERELIAHRFPQLTAGQIMSLQEEQFERDLARKLTGDRQRKGVRVLLSNLGGEGLWASLRSVGMHGRIVQLNSSDPGQGVRMGMNVFLKSTSFYGLEPTCLVRCADAVKKELHELLQDGLDAGTVRPLDRTVLPASHAKQAVSCLDGDSSGKVVLELKVNSALSKTIDGRRFLCDDKASYLVVGGGQSHALHTADWLLSRGARCVVLAGLVGAAGAASLGQVTLRRLALMRARWGAHVTTVPGVQADTAQGAATLVSRANNMAPLAAVFVLPSASARQDDVLQALDGVLRGPGPSREAVLLVAVELGRHSERVAAACAARRRAGGRAALVALNVAQSHLRVLAMDNALVDPEPVLHVNLLQNDVHQATVKERLSELLPLSLAGLESLGRAALHAPSTTSSFLPTGFGGVAAKSREVPPAFLIGGLRAAPAAELQPLARLLQSNAVLLVPGSKGRADVCALAADMLVQVLAHQATGPYTLLARGWGGLVALEMARLLEARGQRVAVMLVDCAPQVVLDAVRGLGQGAAMQAWLLCSLLHLPPAVYDVLETLPSWSARLQLALSAVASDAEDADMGRERRARRHEALAAGLDVVHSRLCALSEYRADLQLKQTVITLLRPVGAEADNFCGLDKVSALPVQVAVMDSALGTPSFWRGAARVVSAGVYVGGKPMYEVVVGKSTTMEQVWKRLR